MNDNNILFLGSKVCQQTKILFGMVITFVFCQFFPIVGDAYELICLLEGNSTEGICESNIHIENCINFGHFMLMVNSSVNFIFYMTNIAKFRQEFLKVYGSVLLLINANIFIEHQTLVTKYFEYYFRYSVVVFTRVIKHQGSMP